MHVWTRLKKESEGKTGLGIYPDGMVEHDGQVGQVLDKLKELGLEDTTIVMYSTGLHRQRRGGTHVARWRRNAVPWREKYQLGRRLPCADGYPLAWHDQARYRAQRHLRP
jgi:arylsulfatase